MFVRLAVSSLAVSGALAQALLPTELFGLRCVIISSFKYPPDFQLLRTVSSCCDRRPQYWGFRDMLPSCRLIAR
jgi:hypothetical protein